MLARPRRAPVWPILTSILVELLFPILTIWPIRDYSYSFQVLDSLTGWLRLHRLRFCLLVSSEDSPSHRFRMPCFSPPCAPCGCASPHVCWCKKGSFRLRRHDKYM